MPFMRINWANHDAWCRHMTYEQRGLFDAARSVLWSVVGCRLPLDTLRIRMGIKPGSKADKLLAGLIEAGSLRLADGLVFDEVQVNEFGLALEKANVNAKNGAKGGRPKASSGASEGTPTREGSDF